MRRLLRLAPVALIALAAACSTDSSIAAPHSAATPVAIGANGTQLIGDVCWVTPAALEQLFQDALVGGAAPPPEDTLSIAQAATQRLRNALRQLPDNESVALTQAGNLKDFLRQRFAVAQFRLLADASTANDDIAAAQLATMLAAIDYLVKPAGTSPACPPGTLGSNGGRIYNDTRLAGVSFPAGALSQPALVRFRERTTPLPTDLTQYPLFFDIEALSLANGEPVTLGTAVDVGVCLRGNPDLTAGLDLRLAHGVGSQVGDVEILPTTLQDPGLLEGLACDPFANQVLAPVFYRDVMTASAAGPMPALLGSMARVLPQDLAVLLLPTALQAQVRTRCCTLGGSAGSLSPFGAVDLNSAAIQAVGPASFEALAGATLQPSVRLFNKDRGTAFGLRGETVRFAVTGGGGSTTPLEVRTSQTGDGLATTRWTITGNDGNTLTATGLVGRVRTAPPLAIPLVPVPAANGNPVTFTATVVVPLTGFTWGFGVYGDEPSAISALFAAAALPQSGTTFARHPNCSLRADKRWIALRRPFTTQGNRSVAVTITTDTEVRVWVDNVEITGVTPVGGYAPNTNCPSYTTRTFRADKDLIAPGKNHVLRVLGRDKANSLYFNSSITTY